MGFPMANWVMGQSGFFTESYRVSSLHVLIKNHLDLGFGLPRLQVKLMSQIGF